MYFRYGTVWGPLHGGTAGSFTDHNIVLNNGVYINRVEGSIGPITIGGITGTWITQLTFYATDGQVYGPYGDHDSVNGVRFVSSRTGYKLLYISGLVTANTLMGPSFHYEALETTPVINLYSITTLAKFTRLVSYICMTVYTRCLLYICRLTNSRRPWKTFWRL